MKSRQMLGGVIVGAGAALIANALLFGSFFADGGTERAMFVLAGLALCVSITSVGLTALLRPSGAQLLGDTARQLTSAA